MGARELEPQPSERELRNWEPSELKGMQVSARQPQRFRCQRIRISKYSDGGLLELHWSHQTPKLNKALWPPLGVRSLYVLRLHPSVESHSITVKQVWGACRCLLTWLNLRWVDKYPPPNKAAICFIYYWLLLIPFPNQLLICLCFDLILKLSLC